MCILSFGGISSVDLMGKNVYNQIYFLLIKNNTAMNSDVNYVSVINQTCTYHLFYEN